MSKIVSVFCLLIFLISNIVQGQSSDVRMQEKKIAEVLSLIHTSYVDSVHFNLLAESAIRAILEQLDPHSSYYTAEELKISNEPLKGTFEGIGIQYLLFRDTLLVTDVLPNSPAEMNNLQVGDRIIKANHISLVGKSITHKEIQAHLRKEKGTKIPLLIWRYGELITKTVTCDAVPLRSIESSFIMQDTIGYISVSTFSATTIKELDKILTAFVKKGVKALVLDVRDNTGGYLNSAIQMADEFIEGDELLVYTQGIRKAKQTFTAHKKGAFEHGKLVVLINNRSASASEIVAGAIQDLDRGLIIGERSYAKGLVQNQYGLSDGSAIRLTTGRYYTPSGRCIQKAYTTDRDAYKKEIYHRTTALPDTIPYYTKNKRIVYSHGGIIPDIVLDGEQKNTPIYQQKIQQEKWGRLFLCSYPLSCFIADLDTLNSTRFIQGYIVSDKLIETFLTFIAYDTLVQKKTKADYYAQVIKQQVDNTKDKWVSQSINGAFDFTITSEMLQEAADLYAIENERFVADKLALHEWLKGYLKAELGYRIYGKEVYYRLLSVQDRGIQKALFMLQEEQFSPYQFTH